MASETRFAGGARPTSTRTSHLKQLDIAEKIKKAAAIEAQGYLNFVNNPKNRAHNVFKDVVAEAGETAQEAQLREATRVATEVLEEKLAKLPIEKLTGFGKALDNLIAQTDTRKQGLILVGDVELRELPEEGEYALIAQTIDVVILTMIKGEVLMLTGGRLDSPEKLAVPGGFIEPPAILRFQGLDVVTDAKGRTAVPTGGVELNQETGISAAQFVSVVNHVQRQSGVDAERMSIPGMAGSLAVAGGTYAFHLGGGSRTDKVTLIGFMPEQMVAGRKAGDDFASIGLTSPKKVMERILEDAARPEGAKSSIYSNHGTSVIPIAMLQANNLASLLTTRLRGPIGELVDATYKMFAEMPQEDNFTGLWDQVTSLPEVGISLDVHDLDHTGSLLTTREIARGEGPYGLLKRMGRGESRTPSNKEVLDPVELAKLSLFD